MTRSLLLLACTAAFGQTLPEVVEAAMANYPAVRVSREQLNAAAANIALARTAYLPRADFLAQLNRATRNNVFGLLLPQSTLPGISGPPNPQNDMTSVWGTAVGVLVSWEPFDFGLRGAQVEVAESARRRADAAVARTQFEVGVLAADAYLTALAAEQTVRAAEAQLERSRTVSTIVGALAGAELRPGADVSRSNAEIASAEAQVIQAQNALEAARITLRQLTGKDVRPVAGPLLARSGDIEAGGNVAGSPVALEQASAVGEADAQRRALDRAYFPRFNLQGASYARGTGANADGTTLGGASGLGPNIHNWAVGLSVTFPIGDLPALRARKQAAEHRRLSEAARYDQVVTDLQARLRTAEERLTTARKVAALVPRQLEAAQAANAQSTARYQAGLGTLVEVADAQRLLTQAQIDEALARLNIWRALLAVSAATGDLEPFLRQVK